MSRHRVGRVARGLAALAALATALIGVPVALTALGQGLPGGLPSWGGMNGVARGLTHAVSDNALLRAAGLTCWLVWALFALAVVIEVLGQMVGGGRRRAGTIGRRMAIPGFQGWARTLVLGAALLLPQRGMVGAIAAPSVPATLQTAAAPPGPPVTGSTATVASAPAHRLPSGDRRYVVKRYDSLWSIAERHLGRGTRWREIRDEAGRLVGDEGARARIIHPGDVLFLPPDGGLTRRTARPAAPGPDATPRRSAAVAPRLPAPAPTAPAAPTTVPAPAAAAAPVTTTTSPPPTMVAVAADQGRTMEGTGIAALVEAGLVGAATMGIVGALRRRQARLRPEGRRIRLPDAGLARTELALRRTETPERMTLVERALDSLALTLREQGTAPPQILGVLVDDDAVEVLLARPTPPPSPSPWVAGAEGFRWRIDHSDLTTDRLLQSPPLPALACVGRVAAGTADALLNLEAAGLVGVTGDPAEAAGMVCGVATHLIGAPWARAANLVLLGFPPGLAATDNVREISSLTELAEELRATADVMATTARQHDCPDLVTGRFRGRAGDGWPPVVVLSARPLRGGELGLLTDVARAGTGVAAVVVDPGGDGRWVIDAASRPCPITPLRLAVNPTVLDPAVMAAISELVGVADDIAGAGLDDPPYNRVELSVDRGTAMGAGALPAQPAQPSLTLRLARLDGDRGDRGASGSGPDRANGSSAPAPLPDLGTPPILVRVLGSVEVDGASEFKRAKSRELVVYLAMHPHGVGEAELDEALWGSSGARVVVASTRDATVSVARTALGGAARLLPAQGQGREKRYQLGPEVQSDWAQFCTLHRFGRDHQSAAPLHLALELVRGRPFAAVISGRTYGWIHTEGHGRHIEAEVADAADLAAALYLGAGDPLAARWAARRGLLAEPYTERLWVRLMEAADLLGESQEIERIMDEMDVVLELEGDFTGLHPNTLAVYDRLSRRHRFPAAT